MTKLPKDIKHLNLSHKEFMKLTKSDLERIYNELPMNDFTIHSETHPDFTLDDKLPCVVDGLLLY